MTKRVRVSSMDARLKRRVDRLRLSTSSNGIGVSSWRNPLTVGRLDNRLLRQIFGHIGSMDIKRTEQ